ncbi:protein translocase subunit SecD [Candidatus Poribacteria bacterium]|nr:protein translocase subunit SecD [Candidatus Poribacteria bacterium]MYF54824.1 protein translocase subunit SecD [Candidatus Poribacteria bacterium]
MYRFNIWKIVLIIGVLLLSLLYLMPTPDSLYLPLYGNLPLWIQEDLPRFEVTEDNAFKVNLADVDYPEGKNLQEATDELQDVFNVQLKKLEFEENVDYAFDSTEEKEFFVRLISDKAKENPAEILENLHLYGSIPPTLRKILPANRLKLGLDLKGGVHLVLEIDLEKSKRALLRDNAYAIPETLKAEQIICRQAEQVSGEDALNVLVEIPSRLKSEKEERDKYIKKAVELLNDVDFFEDAEVVTENESQSMYRLSLTEKSMQEYSDEAIQQVLIVLRNRVDAFGVAEPSIRQEANRPRIIIELPGAKDSSEPLRIVQTMGRLEFKIAKKHPSGGSLYTGSANTPPPEELEDNTEIRYHHETGDWYVLESPVLLSGHNIEDSRPSTGSAFNIVVLMTFDSEGSNKFAKITGEHIGEHLAILLDDKVQSAPVIRTQIRRNAMIEGNFTSEEANYLSNILNAGAFPVGVQVGEERAVAPTLGQESIDNGIKAAIIGLGFVLFFMILYYRLSGIIAIIALVFNMIIIISALAGFGAALTLPGIAGLVLTIGMAVDANVLIFERIREELRSGKAVWDAITNGYQRAFITILDANLTTFFTALVLYHFGTGPIRGFAVTLGIGILASMFTAIVVTREIYGLVIGNRDVQKLSI